MCVSIILYFGGRMRKQILVFVCDKGIRENLTGIINCISGHLTTWFVSDSSEGYKVLLEHKIDTFICGFSGKQGGETVASVYRFIATIRTVPQYCFTPVILVSNLEDPGNYCYRELHCFDVFEYPFYAEQFLRTLQKALCFSRHRNEDRMLYVKEENILYPIRCSQIEYIQSSNHVMELSLRNGCKRRLRYFTMQQLLDVADVGFLLQCARSVIVNTNYIQCIDYTNRIVTMQDRVQLPIGSTYVKVLQERFQNIQTR